MWWTQQETSAPSATEKNVVFFRFLIFSMPSTRPSHSANSQQLTTVTHNYAHLGQIYHELDQIDHDLDKIDHDTDQIDHDLD